MLKLATNSVKTFDFLLCAFDESIMYDDFYWNANISISNTNSKMVFFHISSNFVYLFFLFTFSPIVLYQKRFKKERKTRIRMQQKLDSEIKRRNQIEDTLKASGAPSDALRLLSGKLNKSSVSLNSFHFGVECKKSFSYWILTLLLALLILTKKTKQFLRIWIIFYIFAKWCLFFLFCLIAIEQNVKQKHSTKLKAVVNEKKGLRQLIDEQRAHMQIIVSLFIISSNMILRQFDEFANLISYHRKSMENTHVSNCS